MPHLSVRPGRVAQPLRLLALAVVTGLVVVSLAAATPVRADEGDEALVLEVTTTEDLAADNGHVACPADEGEECSLRAAVQRANAEVPGAEVEIVLPAGTYELTIEDEGAGDASEGQLDIDLVGTLTLRGDAAATTTIDAGGEDGVGRILHVDVDVDLRLHDLTFTGGYAAGAPPGDPADGGAMRLRAGQLLVTDSVFTGNHADRFGGAIRPQSSVVQVRIERTRFVGNEAGSDGGAYDHVGSGTATIIDSSFVDNRSSRSGGAIYTSRDMEVLRSTFAGNRGVVGGAIYSLHAAVLIGTSTLVENTAEQAGGAISNGGDLQVLGSTVVDNEVLEGGSVQLHGRESFTHLEVERSIFWGPADACGGPGAATSAGHNLAGDGSCGFDPDLGDVLGEDPLLAPLAQHAGWTPTMALTPGSPARDAGGAGCADESDQRGLPRPQNDACDIGAYEFGFGDVIGTVVDADGVGIADAEIAVNPTATTDEDGRFAFDDLPEGPALLTVTAEGYEEFEVEVRIIAGEELALDAIALTATSGPEPEVEPEPEPEPEETVEPVDAGVEEQPEEEEVLPETGAVPGSLLWLALAGLLGGASLLVAGRLQGTKASPVR